MDSVTAAETVRTLKQLKVLDVIEVADVAQVPERVRVVLDSIGLSDIVRIGKLIMISDEIALVEVVFTVLPHVPFYLPLRVRGRLS
jgi:hypothetical protein